MYGFLEVLPLSKKKDFRWQVVAIKKWILIWTKLFFKRLDYKDKNNNKLVKLLFYILNLYLEKQYLVNQCLEIGYRNGLFKKTHNSCIINADADDIADNTA